MPNKTHNQDSSIPRPDSGEILKFKQGYFDGCDYDFLWTFYRLATNRGSVVIRWYGTSNGYYAINVSFKELFLNK